MHILICEDEHFIRRALAEHLAALEYQISEVENGLECLEFVSATKPDLILMDLKMPVMDGQQTIAKLEEQSSNIPIIILSGYGADHEMLAKYEYIPKPYKLSEVSQLIQAKFRR
jgi:CheY-like chemotaxis protein